MKLTVGLIFFALISVTAGNSYSQTARISLNMKNANIVDVFREIERNSEFGFFFKSEELNLESRKSINVKDATIDEVLKKILDEGFSYKILDRNIVVTKGSLDAMQQDKKINGRVTDLSGTPLPGVSIVIKGTSTGIITDANGNFKLSNLAAGTTLVFSFVGMKMQEIRITDQTFIAVKMEETTIGVETVVVTALGIKRSEKALGYAVQKVSGESLQKVSGVDLATSLTGKVAGLLVKNSTDFAVAPELTIRDEKPLLVIDGVAYENKTLSDISSEDIESMSVLKGATASAL